MRNSFYTDFDFATAEERTEIGGDTRTPFQRDRDRIVHTSAFRRMQAKTQVFGPGEYDFYRTRLTHSIEVGQIGRAVAARFNETALDSNFYIDLDLIEAICLAHDLGHPPFGHAGERELNKLMSEFGGFEGNAQTLRLIWSTIYSEDNARKGMKPTRAFADGTMKYKALYSKSDKNKHFIYDDQHDVLKFVMPEVDISGLSQNDANSYKSIECQIMDFADDTAYSINDLGDRYKAGIISDHQILSLKNEFSDVWSYVDELISADTKNKSLYLNKVMSRFIMSVSLEKKDTVLAHKSNRYKYILRRDERVTREMKCYKEIAKRFLFGSSGNRQLEHKGKFMIRNIFEALETAYLGENVENLLMPEVQFLIKNAASNSEKARILCDYIAGMTDGFAARFYRRLYDPSYGSLLDLA